MQTVAVLGGGVAGMTAAQELAERGFSVTLIEARPQLGGRQLQVHLLRPPWRHLHDTLSRVPSPWGGQLTDHLTQAPQTLFARAGGSDALTVACLPEDAGALYEGLRAMLPYTLGLEDEEVRRFASRLQVLLGSCQQRRAREWERSDWWSFLGASEASEAYQRILAQGLAGAMSGLPPRQASASAVGYALLQRLVQGAGCASVTWRGPSGGFWWEPWQRHLLRLGVDLRLGTRAVGLRLGQGRIEAALLEDGAPHELRADHFVLALPLHQASALVQDSLLALDRDLEQLRWLARHSSQEQVHGHFVLAQDAPLARGQVIYLDQPWGLSSVSPVQFWDQAPAPQRGLLQVTLRQPDQPDAQGRTLRQVDPALRPRLLWQAMHAHLNEGGQAPLPPDFESAHLGAPEPRFVPLPGVTARLPRAQTRVPNLTLAGRYVRVGTLVHGPERANEAARRAVNAVLQQARRRARPCALWEPRWPASWWARRGLDQARWRLGLPHAEVV